MRTYFLLNLIVITTITSCTHSTIPKYIKTEFKYSPSISTQSKLLSYNGLYKELHTKSDSAQKLCSKFYYTFNDSIYKKVGAIDIVFLKNGLCTMGFLNELRTASSKKENFKNGGSYWGYYKINHDTLRIKVIQRNSLMAGSTDAFEQWYKIIDLQTLKPIYFRSITKETCAEKWGGEVLIDTTQYRNAKLYEIDENLISPNTNWLINKKWFWKSAEEYKTWKKLTYNK